MDKREEVLNAVNYLANNHDLLRKLQKQGYVATLVHTVAKM